MLIKECLQPDIDKGVVTDDANVWWLTNRFTLNDADQ